MKNVSGLQIYEHWTIACFFRQMITVCKEDWTRMMPPSRQVVENGYYCQQCWWIFLSTLPPSIDIVANIALDSTFAERECQLCQMSLLQKKSQSPWKETSSPWEVPLDHLCWTASGGPSMSVNFFLWFWIANLYILKFQISHYCWFYIVFILYTYILHPRLYAGKC